MKNKIIKTHAEDFEFEHVGEFLHDNKYVKKVSYTFYTDEHKQTYKHEKGAYMLVENKSIVYVGKTNRSIISRMSDHTCTSNIHVKILNSVRNDNKLYIFICKNMHGFKPGEVEAMVIGRLLKRNHRLWNRF